MKTYVLTVSKVFPKTHKRAGESTGFVEDLSNLFIRNTTKIHTIRANYDFWSKRIAEINKGNAILSIRYWSGKPYNTPQVEICRLEKVGIQSIQMTPLGWFIDDLDSDYTTKDFATNDGLSIADFNEWFRGKIKIDMEPMAIIHFTNFRY